MDSEMGAGWLCLFKGQRYKLEVQKLLHADKGSPNLTNYRLGTMNGKVQNFHCRSATGLGCRKRMQNKEMQNRDAVCAQYTVKTVFCVCTRRRTR